jgi:ABC-type phosphate/phosphonate transport system substrate-binding protein
VRLASFLAPALEPLYRAASEAVGAELVQGEDFEALFDGSLDGAFMCGLPYVRLRDRGLEAVAAPVPQGDRYAGLPVYFSDIVGTDRAGRFAVNEEGSFSGFVAVGGEDYRERVITGSHAASLAAVYRGDADWAAIDSHVLDVVGTPAGVEVAASVGPFPITPLVGAPGADVEALRRAVTASAPAPGMRTERWAPVTDADYDPIRRLAARSRTRPSGA